MGQDYKAKSAERHSRRFETSLKGAKKPIEDVECEQTVTPASFQELAVCLWLSATAKTVSVAM